MKKKITEKVKYGKSHVFIQLQRFTLLEVIAVLSCQTESYGEIMWIRVHPTDDDDDSNLWTNEKIEVMLLKHNFQEKTGYNDINEILKLLLEPVNYKWLKNEWVLRSASIDALEL